MAHSPEQLGIISSYWNESVLVENSLTIVKSLRLTICSRIQIILQASSNDKRGARSRMFLPEP